MTKSTKLAGLLFVLVQAVSGQMPPRLTYGVEVKDGDWTTYHHSLLIDRPQTDAVRLSVAAWAPGSYRLMGVSKDIADVTATDERGAPRGVTKEGDLTWIVDGKGATSIRVSWKFQNPGKGVNNRTYLTSTGGLLDGPRNYLYWRDHKELPAHVHFKLPEGWKVATGLTATFDPMVYVANDTDWLLDCPVLLGKIETWTFDVGGVPHRVAFDNRGREVEFNSEQFVDCVRRITQTATDLWGVIPYPHYTYIFSAGGGGGLEHLTSTTIGASTRALASNPNSHQGVIAHEFFHAWNVKRLRPKALGPFDYDGPVRTKSLWISEGLTNYYTNVILSRSGLADESQFIAGYERTIGEFLATKGYRTISPEEASWTVWDAAYMSNPVSYYTQGEVLGLLMDLEIRGQSKNQKSLDDGMKLLYQRFSGKSGFQSEDVVSTIFDATGVDLHDFFLKHVSAAQPIEWQKYFRHMGYLARMSRNPRVAISFESLTGGEDGVIIKVFQDSALARIGLKNDDVITAFNGRPVKTGGELQQILRTLEVGAAMDYTVRRGKETVSVKGAVEAATDVVELLGRRGSRMAVTRLDPESAVAQSGLANGDVIKAVNGTPVADREQYHVAVGKITDGEVVKFTVDRGGTEHVIEHRATQSVTTNFRLTPDPSASPLELEIRRALILGPAKTVAETRPAKRAG